MEIEFAMQFYCLNKNFCVNTVSNLVDRDMRCNAAAVTSLLRLLGVEQSSLQISFAYVLLEQHRNQLESEDQSQFSLETGNWIIQKVFLQTSTSSGDVMVKRFYDSFVSYCTKYLNLFPEKSIEEWPVSRQNSRISIIAGEEGAPLIGRSGYK